MIVKGKFSDILKPGLWWDFDMATKGPMFQDTANRVLDKILELSPRNATGIYVTSDGISFGYRTNRKKFPKNFIYFEDLFNQVKKDHGL